MCICECVSVCICNSVGIEYMDVQNVYIFELVLYIIHFNTWKVFPSFILFYLILLFHPLNNLTFSTIYN